LIRRLLSQSGRVYTITSISPYASDVLPLARG
jgi:hypothetical protein